jgi:hypothetical protein
MARWYERFGVQINTPPKDYVGPFVQRPQPPARLVLPVVLPIFVVSIVVLLLIDRHLIAFAYLPAMIANIAITVRWRRRRGT